ncbi:MAG: isocitrate lyase/PEP mutase family protein [Planctomycetia bacterium]
MRERILSGPKGLRALINHEPIVRCLGAHDVLSAELIEQAGMESIFVGGFGVSASMVGLPDMNLITLTNMTDMARRVTNAVSVPVIVDADTGHGDLHNVQRTFEMLEQAGAAGITLEDQIVPKRCGHFAGKQVISAREMVLKIMAATDVRKNQDVVLIARTDARSMLGFDEAIDRACMYGEAGADVLYVEAPETIEELEAIPKRVPYPVMVNMLTGGRTPMLTVDEVRGMGYRMVLWPIESILITATAIQKLVKTILDKGSLAEITGDMASFRDIQDLLGLPGILNVREKIEKQAAGKF